MTTSRYGAVVDALVALFATTGRTVYDGPTLSGDRPTEYVVVGGTEDSDDDAGEFTQDWAGIGAKAKNETGEVVCALLVSTGDGDVRTARDAALSFLSTLGDLLRADPNLAGALGPAGWCHLASGRPSQRQTSEGVYVRVAFTIVYQSRI